MSKFKLSTIAVAVGCATFFSASSVSLAADIQNVATGIDAIAIGSGSQATGRSSIVIGLSANSTANNQIVFGAYAKGGDSDHSQAIGVQASSTATGGLSYGFRTSTTAAGSVALGRQSTSSRLGGTFGSESNALAFDNSRDGSEVWVSTDGAVSIGSNVGDTDYKGNTVTKAASRQLTGLAAGSQDNDAVNVAQLKSLKNYSDATFTTASNTIFGSGASNVISEVVLDDPETTDVNEAKDAVYAQNAVVLGNNAKVQLDNSVAIGAGSVASMTGRNETAPQFNNSGATDGAWKSEGLVSFGYTETVPAATEGGEATYVTHNRTLTGVAAGSEDNDAVNVAQLKEVNNQVQGLITGETKVSTIQLLATDEAGKPITSPEGKSETIGLRYQVASAEPAPQAEGDAVATSQGRLIYNNIGADGNQIGTTPITVATLNDGFTISAGNTGTDGNAPVNVSLNQGISFLGDEYLQTTVTAGENGGAVVTIGASEDLKKFLVQSGVQPSDPTNPSNPGNSGNSGGTWTPNAAQQAALNGNFANGITVAAGEGNQAIQIKQGNVDMGGNRIQNVGNPINDGDAANKAYVDGTNRSLRNKINDVDKDLRAGVAMAMAVGGLPQAYMPGKSIFGVSAGTYHGQGGFALGLSHATDNRQWVFKGAASVDTRGNVGGTLSAGYQF